MGMVDISQKPIILRTALASGKIRLLGSTLEQIKTGSIRKGDPLAVAELMAINGAKQTSSLIPFCHQIPLDTVGADFEIIDGEGIRATCFVKTQARTGVEMEALVGVTMALNTIWDMVKYLEKDDQGQYPHTRITDIKVIKKEKIEST
jgi:cyclic pyranopterin phosphate synthase